MLTEFLQNMSELGLISSCNFNSSGHIICDHRFCNSVFFSFLAIIGVDEQIFADSE